MRHFHVEPIKNSEVDASVSEARQSTRIDGGRAELAEGLIAALRTDQRPARPAFPEDWRSEPDVIFEPDDPKPESFEWGQPKWRAGTEAYETTLADLLGDLACGRNVPEAQTRGIARRGLEEIAMQGEPDILRQLQLRGELPAGPRWPALVSQRLTGPDCPPAKGLPDHTRWRLEELATWEVSSNRSVPEAAE